MIRHLLSIPDCRRDEIVALLELARQLKTNGLPPDLAQVTRGKVLGLLFQKPSTRTRVSFEVGMAQLGGSSVFMTEHDLQLTRGESVSDSAAVLSRYLNVVVLRAHTHEFVETFANHATIPVINGLTDLLHPCQILSDLLTMQEHCGRISDLKVGYLGDGNNVAHSWLLGAAMTGMHLVMATPAAREPKEQIVRQALDLAESSGAQVELTHEPMQAAKDADILYTDVWVSMGMEETHSSAPDVFQPFQINADLLASTGKPTKVMHCLPAHRGQEITDEVMDSPASIVFEQAENRLHLQKALLAQLLLWATESG